MRLEWFETMHPQNRRDNVEEVRGAILYYELDNPNGGVCEQIRKSNALGRKDRRQKGLEWRYVDIVVEEGHHLVPANHKRKGKYETNNNNC